MSFDIRSNQSGLPVASGQYPDGGMLPVQALPSVRNDLCCPANRPSDSHWSDSDNDTPTDNHFQVADALAVAAPVLQ